MVLKKTEFTPESGNVDTYVIASGTTASGPFKFVVGRNLIMACEY